MRLQFSKYYAPPDTTAGASIEGNDKETFELINEEPEEVLDLGDKGKKDEAAEEDEEAVEKTETGEGDEEDDLDDPDELKDIEEELKGPKEEDLELTTPVRRREILAKYPKLFKDFPYLEKAYYGNSSLPNCYRRLMMRGRP